MTTTAKQPVRTYEGTETFTVRIICSDDLTVVTVEADPVPFHRENGRQLFTGVARRHPGDRPNEIVGTAVATHRALQALVRWYGTAVDDLVEQNTLPIPPTTSLTF